MSSVDYCVDLSLDRPSLAPFVLAPRAPDVEDEESNCPHAEDQEGGH